VEKVSMVIFDDSDVIIAGVHSMLAPFGERLQMVCAPVGRVAPVVADVALVDAHGHPELLMRRLNDVLSCGTFEHVAVYAWRVSERGAQAYLAAGASAVLNKAASAEQTARSIELVSEGKQVVDDFDDDPFRPSWPSSDPALSSRDLEILALLARGYDNTEIGGELFLAESTVKTYVKRLYQSLGVHTRAQAVLRAVDMGLTRHHPGA